MDNTVSVTITLADSFDVLPDGKCAGRSDNSGMYDGAKVQLRGDTVGGSVSSIATAKFEVTPAVKKRPDDHLYCIVRVVFSPERPDPSSRYSIKFVGGDWMEGIKVGREKFGRLDRPGYGSATILRLLCESLVDPPSKECPEPTS